MPFNTVYDFIASIRVNMFNCGAENDNALRLIFSIGATMVLLFIAIVILIVSPNPIINTEYTKIDYHQLSSYLRPFKIVDASSN